MIITALQIMSGYADGGMAMTRAFKKNVMKCAGKCETCEEFDCEARGKPVDDTPLLGFAMEADKLNSTLKKDAEIISGLLDVIKQAYETLKKLEEQDGH